MLWPFQDWVSGFFFNAIKKPICTIWQLVYLVGTLAKEVVNTSVKRLYKLFNSFLPCHGFTNSQSQILNFHNFLTNQSFFYTKKVNKNKTCFHLIFGLQDWKFVKNIYIWYGKSKDYPKITILPFDPGTINSVRFYKCLSI